MLLVARPLTCRVAPRDGGAQGWGFYSNVTLAWLVAAILAKRSWTGISVIPAPRYGYQPPYDTTQSPSENCLAGMGSEVSLIASGDGAALVRRATPVRCTAEST